MFGAVGLQAADSILAPVWQFATPEFHYALGLNTASRDRYHYYRNNREAVLYPRGPDHTPTNVNYAQLLQLFNQAAWPRAEEDEELRHFFWERLRADLRNHGIDMMEIDRYMRSDPFTLPGEYEAAQWTRMISMSGSGAPLGAVLRDYYRSLPLQGDRKAVDLDELRFNLQRAQFRRKEDRDRLMSPFADWTLDDITRLKWAGVINHDVETSLMNAAGVTRSEDYRLRSFLEQRLPDPHVLVHWANRLLWDAETLAAFELDANFELSPVAQFFARKQGLQAPIEYPDQPDGEKDWLKLAYRASRKIPTFAECRQLQWRLRRRRRIDRDIEVLPEQGEWNAGHTRLALQTEGYPDKIIQQLLATVPEPMPLHLLATVITPLLEHSNVKDIVEQQFGVRFDWLYEALKDHGFTDAVATVSAAAIRQEATDKKFAEMIATKKRIRGDSRAAYLEAYRMGTEDANTVMRHITGEQYTERMAQDEFAVIDLDITNEIAKMKLGALKEAFMSGQKNEAETRRGFGILEFAEVRINQYLEIWNWERTVNHRQLTTAEIMQGLKAGIIQPGQAIQRMVNLGWTNADAMVEIQLVQHELAVAQAKAAATAQAHARQEAVQLTRAQQIAAAHARAAAAKAAAEQAKVTKEQALAIHQKLLAESEYYAKVHTSNDAYAAAEKKGDDEKMLAELLKQQAAYQDWLIRQIELASEGIGVQREIGPIQTAQAAGPHSGTPTNGAASPPNSPGH